MPAYGYFQRVTTGPCADRYHGRSGSAAALASEKLLNSPTKPPDGRSDTRVWKLFHHLYNFVAHAGNALPPNTHLARQPVITHDDIRIIGRCKLARFMHVLVTIEPISIPDTLTYIVLNTRCGPRYPSLDHVYKHPTPIPPFAPIHQDPRKRNDQPARYLPYP